MTGGSAGIGFGIAAHLLQHKADNVTILSNKEEHAQSALEELKEYGDASKAHWVKCDFEDLKFTEKVANELARSQDKLDGVSDALDRISNGYTMVADKITHSPSSSSTQVSASEYTTKQRTRLIPTSKSTSSRSFSS